jgi:hypothetical protein
VLRNKEIARFGFSNWGIDFFMWAKIERHVLIAGLCIFRYNLLFGETKSSTMHIINGTCYVLLSFFPVLFLNCTSERSGTVDDKTQLLALEHKWLEAEFGLDTAYLSSIIDNSFIGISGSEIHNKHEDILDMYNNISQRIKDSIVIDSFKLESPVVNLYDNTAVVTFIVHTHGRSKQAITERRTRFYDVWVRRGKEWKAVASQGSKVE